MRTPVLLSCAFLVLAFAAEANEIANVTALRETEPVGASGDAADDPAIILGPTVEDTRIIGTQKQGGLYVYDLSGRVVQSALSGRPNNIDVRDAFPWADGAAPIVVTSDRIDNTIAIYRFDPQTRRLDPQARARIPTGFAEVYGIALGRRGNAFVAVATSKTGDVAQWTLTPEATGIKADKTRAFSLGSIAEGAVIDDETATLYVSQELVGLWRLSLDPAKGDKGELVDAVAPKGRLIPDVEGVAIWRKAGDAGYLIVSAQGDSRFNVYDRAPPNTYRGSFRIKGDTAGKVDEVTTTDGLEASGADLGPEFPRGILIVQDDLNTLPDTTQNFKFVSWAYVERALNLAP